MKKMIGACAACLSLCACIKQQTGPKEIGNLYTSWHVVTIESKHINSPGLPSPDNTYAGQPGDSIKFSAGGEILFGVKGWEHTDTYQATEHNLLKDTVPIITGIPGRWDVYLRIVGTDDFYLVENMFGVDTGEQTIYHLKKD